MKTLSLLLIVAGSVASAFGQANSPDAPPPPPFLKPAPETCQWQIATKSSGNAMGGSRGAAGDNHAAQFPTVTTIFKDGLLVFEKSTLENGSIVRSWCTDGIEVMSISEKPWILVPGRGNSFEDTDFSQSDFAAFDWISQLNFVGRQKVLGRPCLIFKDRGVTINAEQVPIEKEEADELMAQARLSRSEASAAGKSAPNMPEGKTFRIDDCEVEITAYIDEETRLPIALVYMSPKGAMTRIYTFQSLSQMPRVPPEVMQLFRTYQQHLKILGG